VQPASPKPAPQLNQSQHDIWTLDDKLKDVKSPELRAALRRLGSPVNGSDDTNTTSHLDNRSKHPSD
jgi:hypothetical protein